MAGSIWLWGGVCTSTRWPRTPTQALSRRKAQRTRAPNLFSFTQLGDSMNQHSKAHVKGIHSNYRSLYWADEIQSPPFFSLKLQTFLIKLACLDKWPLNVLNGLRGSKDKAQALASGFEYWFWHILVTWPWTSYLTSLNISFIICKLRIIMGNR